MCVLICTVNSAVRTKELIAARWINVENSVSNMLLELQWQCSITHLKTHRNAHNPVPRT